VRAARIQVNLVGGGCPNPASDTDFGLYSHGGKDIADATSGTVRSCSGLFSPKDLAPGIYRLKRTVS
jgi:hypothetical protein